MVYPDYLLYNTNSIFKDICNKQNCLTFHRIYRYYSYALIVSEWKFESRRKIESKFYQERRKP